MDRIVEHWWDQSWSTLWRRDGWLRTDDTTWTVELRQGVHRPPWRHTWAGPTAEHDARTWLAAKLAGTGDQWREIAGSDTNRPG